MRAGAEEAADNSAVFVHDEHARFRHTVPADVAIVIVNYNSGEYLPGCIESLAPARQDGVVAEVVVVDCASPIDQGVHLAAAAANGARIERLSANVGYAGGCNRGLALTRAPYVVFLNADVKACAGAVASLRAFLAERPDVGLAEPRCFIDDGKDWRQPVFEPPTPGRLLSAAVQRRAPFVARAAEHARLRRQVAAWQATAPRELDGLSGAFLAARRVTLDRVGGFDEGYPLAYEDTDLFRRVRRIGLRLAMVPAAEAIHYAHRSRVTVLAEALAKDAFGRERYLRTHHGRLAVWLDRVGRSAGTPSRARKPVVDLGPATAPVELALTGPPGPFVLQLAYDPS